MKVKIWLVLCLLCCLSVLYLLKPATQQHALYTPGVPEHKSI